MSANHSILAHHFEDLEQQRETETLGMWLFLATEILIFGALFTGYTIYRVRYPHDFEAASAKLNVLIGSINTIVLLSSSLTMALSVHATRVGRQKMLLTCLTLTIVLGAIFLGLKALEYYIDYKDILVPGLAFRAGRMDRTDSAGEPAARPVDAGVLLHHDRPARRPHARRHGLCWSGSSCGRAGAR